MHQTRIAPFKNSAKSNRPKKLATMADDDVPHETKLLPDPPTDGVTGLSYLPAAASSSLLASTSWDGTVCLYDTEQHLRVLSHSAESGPLLSLATPTKQNCVVTGGLDGSVRLLDIETSSLSTVGRHGSANTNTNGQDKVGVSCLAALSDSDGSTLIASAAWDRQLHIWDIRQQTPISTVALPGKAFSMDLDKHNQRLAVACSGRRNCFIHVNGPETAMVLERESSLKYQTRVIRYFPDGAAIALGSVEGRVAVEYLEELDQPTSGGKKYAFKCHRSGDLVFPVNCIAFHPRYGTFGTGGCDGTVALWDGLNKKKLTTLPAFATSISALAFSPDGTELAIASSYTFEDGERAHPHDEIHVRKILDSECRPKAKE